MAASDPITAALNIGGALIDRLWPDPAQAASAKLELFKLQQSGELAMMTAQTDIDKAEATNNSPFASGWRPFIGWVCGTGCAWNWVGLPVAMFLCRLFSHPLDIHPADLSEMMPLLIGMLGLGGLRTYEKVTDVTSKNK